MRRNAALNAGMKIGSITLPLMSRTRKKNMRHLGWNHWGVPSWFKRAHRREERTKQNRALREGKEIPIFRKRDAYEYW